MTFHRLYQDLLHLLTLAFALPSPAFLLCGSEPKCLSLQTATPDYLLLHIISSLRQSRLKAGSGWFGGNICAYAVIHHTSALTDSYRAYTERRGGRACGISASRPQCVCDHVQLYAHVCLSVWLYDRDFFFVYS